MYSEFTKFNVLYKPYDICVITAANEYQARGYQEQIRWRMDRNGLPSETEFVVIADPKGKRIGSGGSTIYVLYKLLDQICQRKKAVYSSIPEALKNKRILILHSGGDSKRLPAYSAIGKIFLPLPACFTPIFSKNNGLDGFVALFDLLLNNLMQLPYLDKGQVVVASGDVLLSFDASKVMFDDSGITGLAYPDSVDVASKHGVYIANHHISGEKLRKVYDFLQKPNYEELQKSNGLDIENRAFTDTGIINFSAKSVEILMRSTGVYIEDGELIADRDSLYNEISDAEATLDIYKEFPYAMLGKPIEDGALPTQTHRENIQKFCSILHESAMNGTPFYVYLLPYCEFFHVGTSRHLLQNFHKISHTASIYDFQNFSRSRVKDRSKLQSAFIYNSIIKTDLISSDAELHIEGCYLDGNINVGGENILTCIPDGSNDIRLQKGICLTCIPVTKGQSGWATVIYGIDDDFKKSADDENATFLNYRFLDWLKMKGIERSEIWGGGDPHDLWNAKLFPFNAEVSGSVQASLNLQPNMTQVLDLWRGSQRMSLQEILRSVDYSRFFEGYVNLCQRVNVENLAQILTPSIDLSTDEILSWCKNTDGYGTTARMVLNLIKGSEDILFQARLYRLLSKIMDSAHQNRKEINTKTLTEIQSLPVLQDKGHQESLIASLDDYAFNLICKAIKRGTATDRNRQNEEIRIRIRSDEVVWVCAPVRLDFAGGWTDTPPYCLEHGGSVLNAAVKLNSQYPIQVVGKLHPEPYIRLNSIDLREHIAIYEMSELFSYRDPSNWTSLPKAAFVASGIISEYADLELHEVLEKLGAGVDLTLFSAVPSGSGLGTSSILGSAIIACLSKIFGKELTHESLFNRTLYMEQLMTTGGGWQDQIGGVVGGVKLIRTEPGLFQFPKISWTDLKSNGNSSECFLLYYTGYRRMAKNILKNIVGEYIDRNPVTLRTLDRLWQKSLEMKEQLDHRDIDVFGKSIASVWELNKTLDPGTSNEYIEAIMNRISPYIHGAKLLGAGGGGFLFIVAKSDEQSRRIRNILEKEPPNDKARFFDPDVDSHGLRSSVL